MSFTLKACLHFFNFKVITPNFNLLEQMCFFFALTPRHGLTENNLLLASLLLGFVHTLVALIFTVGQSLLGSLITCVIHYTCLLG